MSLMKPCLIAGATLLFLAAVAVGENSPRIWRSQDGQVLVASLKSADQKAVTLKMPDGSEFVVPLEKLSKADRDYVSGLNSSGQSAGLGPMPAVTRIDPSVAVGGGPQVFSTAHFRFESDNVLTKSFVSEAARIFEGTLVAIEALPLGIVPKPAEGETKFRTRFMSREAFEKEYRSLPREETEAGAVRRTVLKVAGTYIPKRREVLVPFTSLGMTASASNVTLQGNNDLSTLTHEITHQVMHDWLPMMPTWVSEGLAEYLAAVPYQNGSYEFRNAAAGLRKTLLRRHDIADGQTVTLPSPSGVIKAGSAGWRGHSDDYLAAMMLAYFFIELDQPDKPCATMAAYLQVLDQSRQNTEQFFADYNAAVKAFQEKRQIHNREIDAYNAALAKFKTDAAAYNKRVAQYNEQLRARLPQSRRVKLGAKPVPPVAPEVLEVPAILKENPNGGKPVDLVGTIQAKAKPSLYRGREGAALDEALRRAYEGMGIPVKFGNGGN